MNIEPLHTWDVSPTEARLLQSRLKTQVDTSRPLGEWKTLAAADVSFNRHSPVLYAAVIVMKRGSYEVIEQIGVVAPSAFPYVPGLLSFREIPALLKAFASLKSVADVVLCDGQGIAHPRRLGIASHLGLWLGIPTVGCAKSRLCGTFDEPGQMKGDRSPLIDHGEIVGDVLRTRPRVSPLYVSPGHLCDRESAIRLVLETTDKRRLPVPARMVHDYANEVRRSAM